MSAAIQRVAASEPMLTLDTRVEMTARLIIFRRLAEQIPAGRRFGDYTDLLGWALVLVGDEAARQRTAVSPLYARRVLRTCAEMWAALESARLASPGVDLDAQRIALLDIAVRQQKLHRKGGRVS